MMPICFFNVCTDERQGIRFNQIAMYILSRLRIRISLINCLNDNLLNFFFFFCHGSRLPSKIESRSFYVVRFLIFFSIQLVFFDVIIFLHLDDSSMHWSHLFQTAVEFIAFNICCYVRFTVCIWRNGRLRKPVNNTNTASVLKSVKSKKSCKLGAHIFCCDIQDELTFASTNQNRYVS